MTVTTNPIPHHNRLPNETQKYEPRRWWGSAGGGPASQDRRARPARASPSRRSCPTAACRARAAPHRRRPAHAHPHITPTSPHRTRSHTSIRSPIPVPLTADIQGPLPPWLLQEIRHHLGTGPPPTYCIRIVHGKLQVNCSGVSCHITTGYEIFMRTIFFIHTHFFLFKMLATYLSVSGKVLLYYSFI